MKKICILFYLGLLSLGEITAQACLPDLTFTGPYSVTYTKSATWIKSSGITTIPTGADVTWDANPLAGVGAYLELNPGFETMPGSEFLAIVEAVCVGNPLPISLISFDAKPVRNSVELTWKTSSETNSAGFDIERSENGKDFAKIGYVKSDANDGNSNEKLGYSFTDNTPPLGDGGLFYRLKQLDLDGKFTYSAIKSVKIDSEDAVKVYPNPTSDFINVETNNNLKIKNIQLVNAKGSVVYRSNLYENKIDISNQPTGIYFLKIEETSGKITLKKVLKN